MFNIEVDGNLLNLIAHNLRMEFDEKYFKGATELLKRGEFSYTFGKALIHLKLENGQCLWFLERHDGNPIPFEGLAPLHEDPEVNLHVLLDEQAYAEAVVLTRGD